MLRTPDKNLFFHDQRFSYFDFFELDPDIEMIKIDSRAIFCFVADDEILVPGRS